ncbi:hypothetical protein LZQ00_06315 [Sphingobacterium sp. SRCM116780]|uniref:hypothetical protein n=1 Tax=Sphingobacterium sp. SRCM116780 TaxID=2907623 RepID=UPI001F1638C9|nr:hypothetical protein [Sphingobacterium sp. SRCM116780]UIR57428.1 hypothetical protein LZQ00_06315 [Sphingobacterium sp. SRCM116780]
MKTDLYTKTILTVIAVCLCFLVLKSIDLIPQALAGNNGNQSNAMNKNYGLVPLNPDGSINVKLKSADVMNVKLVELDVPSYSSLNVKLAGIDLPSYSSLNVKVVE